MSYKYELIVFAQKNIDFTDDDKFYQVKRFIGNDQNELIERYEMWLIKQPYSRENISISQQEIQHAGYKY